MARYSAAAAAVASLAALNIALLHTAKAAGGYQATDVIGQLDGNGNVDFNSHDFEHYANPNNHDLGPGGMALDSANHKLFVSDCNSGRVLVYNLNSSNNVSGDNAAGRLPANVIGQPDLATYDTSLTASRLNSPCDIAYDSVHERLFVDDSGNSRIMIYDLSGGITNGMTASHVLGQTNFTSNIYDGSVTQNTFSSTDGITYDSANDRLFVADYWGSRVLVFDVNPATITDGENASHVLGQTNFTTGGTATTQNGMAYPQAVSYDSANKRLFVSDGGNARLLVFNVDPASISDGENADHILGQPDFTTGSVHPVSDHTFQGGGPAGLVYDQANKRLFVDDTTRNLIFNADPAALSDNESASHVLGQFDFTSNNCHPSGTEPNRICGAQGNLVYDSANSHFWTSDIGNDRVLEFDLSGGITDGMNAIDDLGQTFGGAYTADMSPTVTQNYVESAFYGYSSASALDPVHHILYVADLGQRVLAYHLDNNNDLLDHHAFTVLGATNFNYGGNSGLPGQEQVGSVFQMVYDPASQYLFTAGDNRITVFDTSGGVSTAMNATHVLGQPDFNSGGSPASQSVICSTKGLAYDSVNKRLFVGDGCGARVLEYDLSGGITDGMNASHVLGQPDFTTVDASACPWNSGPSQNTMCDPTNLSYDESSQHLFVEDEATNRVLVYDLSGGISNDMNATWVIGQSDFTSSGQGTSQSTLNGPFALGFDPTNKYLFVGDSNNNRTLLFDTGTLNSGMAASMVLGQTDFTSSGCSAGTVGACDPEGGDSYDQTNHRLYKVDSNNNRVMIYDFARITTLTLPNGQVNSGYSQTIQKTGGQGTQTYSLVSGSLPGGLGLDGSSGTISGTPTSSGTYSFSVRLTDDNGNIGSYGDTVAYTLVISGGGGGDTIPPSAPLNLRATVTACSSISLAWNVSTDNVGVQGYYIYRNGGPTPLASTVSASYTDNGLVAGTTYTYTVTAYDASNNESAYSSPVAAATSSCSGGGGVTTGSSTLPSVSPPNLPVSLPTAPSTPPTVNLDSIPPVTSASACSNISSAAAGQTYTFTAKDGSGHKITVLQIGAGSLVLQIDNLPKILHVGDLISQDVDGDGQPDICIDVISITGGKVEVKIDRIILAIAPGGHTSSGFGAGNTNGSSPAKTKHHWWDTAVWIFPWLLFILLGSSATRMLYLAYQERRAAGMINRQLELERLLTEEKHNFITLSSHYMRTPLTAISNGIDLLAGAGALANPDQLKTLSAKLSQEVNSLLAKASYQTSSQPQPQNAGVFSPTGRLATAAGFIQIKTMKAMSLTLLGSYAAVGIAYLIIRKSDIYDTSLINLLIQLAAMLLAAVLLAAGIRSHNKRKQLRETAEKLLAEQQELDASRNLLVRESLDRLKVPTTQIKAALQTANPSNPKIAQPALNGLAQLEALLNKFLILTSLESKTMASRRQAVDVSALITQQINSFSQALQNRGLKVNYSGQALQANEDPLLVSFVVSSLLSNAIKYSPNGGEIDIEAAGSPEGIRLKITDQGAGIDQQKLAELFQPFSRAENAATDFSVQGAGLSLYLDKLILDFLGGGIKLDSSSGGTTATVTV